MSSHGDGASIFSSISTVSNTGSWDFPGTCIRDYGALSKHVTGSKGGSGDVKGVGAASILCDDDYVDVAAPVFVACGHGTSKYNVQGCISSYVLLRGGMPTKGGGAVSTGGASASTPHELGYASEVWALRCDGSVIGEGGVTCSSSVPRGSSNEAGSSPRILLTGGKDSMLREWRVTDGRPQLFAEIPG